jgi:hypothetical protein
MGVSKIKRLVTVDYSRLLKDRGQQRAHVNMVIISILDKEKPDTVFMK